MDDCAEVASTQGFPNFLLLLAGILWPSRQVRFKTASRTTPSPSPGEGRAWFPARRPRRGRRLIRGADITIAQNKRVASFADHSVACPDGHAKLANCHAVAGRRSSRKRGEPLFDRDASLDLETKAIAAANLIDGDGSASFGHRTDKPVRPNLPDPPAALTGRFAFVIDLLDERQATVGFDFVHGRRCGSGTASS